MNFFSIDPFVSIDEGVKDLIDIAVLNGKKQNKNLGWEFVESMEVIQTVYFFALKQV